MSSFYLHPTSLTRTLSYPYSEINYNTLFHSEDGGSNDETMVEKEDIDNNTIDGNHISMDIPLNIPCDNIPFNNIPFNNIPFNNIPFNKESSISTEIYDFNDIFNNTTVKLNPLPYNEFIFTDYNKEEENNEENNEDESSDSTYTSTPTTTSLLSSSCKKSNRKSSPNLSIYSSDDNIDGLSKKLDQRQRNRISALKYRNSKKRQHQLLESSIDVLSETNLQKDAKINSLLNENNLLKTQLAFLQNLLSAELVNVKHNLPKSILSVMILLCIVLCIFPVQVDNLEPVFSNIGGRKLLHVVTEDMDVVVKSGSYFLNAFTLLIISALGYIYVDNHKI